MKKLKKAILFTFLFLTSSYSFGQLTESEIAFTKQLEGWHNEATIEFFNKYYNNDTTLNELAKTILTQSLEAEAKKKDSKVIEVKYQNQYSVMMRKMFSLNVGAEGPVMEFFVSLENEINENAKNWEAGGKPLLSLPYKKYGYAFITNRDEKGIEGYIILIFSKN